VAELERMISRSRQLLLYKQDHFAQVGEFVSRYQIPAEHLMLVCPTSAPAAWAEAARTAGFTPVSDLEAGRADRPYRIDPLQLPNLADSSLPPGQHYQHRVAQRCCLVVRPNRTGDVRNRLELLLLAAADGCSVSG
jgi:hypothetical protein